MNGLIFNLILLGIILILFMFLSMIWPPDSPWAPWWRTDKKTARRACEIAQINSLDTVFELGSGDGTFLIVAAKDFGAKALGIEIDPLRYWFSKKRIKINKLANKIEIKKDNFFNADLSKASVVFVYLVPKTLNKLLPKFKKELKIGTKIISFRYKANLPLENFDKKSDLYFYKITKEFKNT